MMNEQTLLVTFMAPLFVSFILGVKPKSFSVNEINAHILMPRREQKEVACPAASS